MDAPLVDRLPASKNLADQAISSRVSYSPSPLPMMLNAIEINYDGVTPEPAIAASLRYHLDLSSSEATQEAHRIVTTGSCVLTTGTGEQASRIATAISAASNAAGYRLGAHVLEATRAKTLDLEVGLNGRIPFSEIKTPSSQAVCVRCGVEANMADRFLTRMVLRAPAAVCARCVAAEDRPRLVRAMLSIGFFCVVALLPLLSRQNTSWQNFNIGLVLILAYPLVLVHEMGHVLAARAVGLEVYGVVFGNGRHLGFMSLLGVPVQIRAVPSTGVTFHSQPIGFRRLRASLVIAGGPGINLLVACASFGVATLLKEDFWSGATFFIDVALANLILGVTNLVPFTIGRLGMPSDGLRLLQIISGRIKAPADPWIGRAAILRAWFLYQWGQFDKVDAVIRPLAETYPFDLKLRMLKSAVAAQLGRVDEALADARMLFSEPSPSAGFDALNHELLAWLLLIAGRASDGEEALRSAWKSFRALQWEPWCRFTCGWAEAVHGDPRIAIELLDPMFGTGEGAHMEAGLYAAKAVAEARRGDKVASLRALLRARRLAPSSRYVAVASSQLSEVTRLSCSDLGATIRPELVPLWRFKKNSARALETDAGPSGRIAGALLLAVGLTILSFCGWVICKVLFSARLGHPDYLFLAGLFSVGALCARIGGPLAANRPNRYYSILTPLEWQVVGIALVTLTFFLLRTITAQGIGKAPEGLVSAVILASMAFGSFYMGRRVKRRLSGAAPG